MQKIIHTTSGDIRLRSSAATVIFYKSEFGKDFFSDAIATAKMFESLSFKEGEEPDFSELSMEEIERIDLSLIYQMLWCFARGADKDIEPLAEWLDNYDDLPLEEVTPAISELMEATFKTTKKSKLKTNQKN